MLAHPWQPAHLVQACSMKQGLQCGLKFDGFYPLGGLVDLMDHWILWIFSIIWIIGFNGVFLLDGSLDFIRWIG